MIFAISTISAISAISAVYLRYLQLHTFLYISARHVPKFPLPLQSSRFQLVRRLDTLPLSLRNPPPHPPRKILATTCNQPQFPVRTVGKTDSTGHSNGNFRDERIICGNTQHFYSVESSSARTCHPHDTKLTRIY